MTAYLQSYYMIAI